MVLEDLHWADPGTLAVVEYLADNLAALPVLCVIAVRSEEGSAALDMVRRQRGRPSATHLELARLDAGEVAAMIRACAPDAASSLAERVSRSAEGVPLLVEELLASPGVPTSFEEAVQQRLAQLGATSRQVIDAAAVLGRRFDWQLLTPMTGLPAPVGDDSSTTRQSRNHHGCPDELAFGLISPKRVISAPSAGPPVEAAASAIVCRPTARRIGRIT